MHIDGNCDYIRTYAVLFCFLILLLLGGIFSCIIGLNFLLLDFKIVRFIFILLEFRIWMVPEIIKTHSCVSLFPSVSEVCPYLSHFLCPQPLSPLLVFTVHILSSPSVAPLALLSLCRLLG